MKFKYIGLKTDGERAFVEKTGIEWMPGDVHDVAHSEAAAEMQKHPTIWEVVEGGSPLAQATTKPAKVHGYRASVTDEDVDEEMDAQNKAKAAEEKAAEASRGAQPVAADTAAAELRIGDMHPDGRIWDGNAWLTPGVIVDGNVDVAGKVQVNKPAPKPAAKKAAAKSAGKKAKK